MPFSAVSVNASGISMLGKSHFGISYFGGPNARAAGFAVLDLAAAVVTSVMILSFKGDGSCSDLRTRPLNADRMSVGNRFNSAVDAPWMGSIHSFPECLYSGIRGDSKTAPGPAGASWPTLCQGVEARAGQRIEAQEELSRGASDGAADQLCGCRADAPSLAPGAAARGDFEVP